jgi:hypothetical protein
MAKMPDWCWQDFIALAFLLATHVTIMVVLVSHGGC